MDPFDFNFALLFLPQNCTHDYMMVDFTGDTMFGNGDPSMLFILSHKYCRQEVLWS